MATVTIRLSAALKKRLDHLSQELGRTRSEILRDALRRQMALLGFEKIRSQLMPFARGRGYLIDEDVFRGVS